MAVGDTNLGEAGQATSFGSAYSGTWVDIGDTWSWANGTAYGLVGNGSMATGDAWAEGSPAPDNVYPTEEPDTGSYHYGITWSSYYDENTEIPAGTTYFYVRGQADCQCRAVSTSTAPAAASTDTSSSASVTSTSSFTPN